MDNERTNRFVRKPPRCLGCARPMQLLRRTWRFGGLPDLYSFYCLACDEWHVEEGNAPLGQLADLGAAAAKAPARR